MLYRLNDEQVKFVKDLKILGDFPNAEMLLVNFETDRVTCPPRADPVSVLDFRSNLHRGEGHGQENKSPRADRQKAA